MQTVQFDWEKRRISKASPRKLYARRCFSHKFPVWFWVRVLDVIGVIRIYLCRLCLLFARLWCSTIVASSTLKFVRIIASQFKTSVCFSLEISSLIRLVYASLLLSPESPMVNFGWFKCLFIFSTVTLKLYQNGVFAYCKTFCSVQACDERLLSSGIKRSEFNKKLPNAKVFNQIHYISWPKNNVYACNSMSTESISCNLTIKFQFNHV